MTLRPSLLLVAGICSLGLYAADSASTTPPSGIDLKAIDKAISPCVDFYQYACGAWVKEQSHPS